MTAVVTDERNCNTKIVRMKLLYVPLKLCKKEKNNIPIKKFKPLIN